MIYSFAIITFPYGECFSIRGVKTLSHNLKDSNVWLPCSGAKNFLSKKNQHKLFENWNGFFFLHLLVACYKLFIG